MRRTTLVTSAFAAVLLLAGCEAGFSPGKNAPDKPKGNLITDEGASRTPPPRGPSIEEVTAELEQRLKTEPKDFGARARLGNIYMRTRRLADAEKLFREGLDLEENEPSSLRGLGEVALFTKDVKLAIDMRERLLEHYPQLDDHEIVYRETFYLRLFDKLGGADAAENSPEMQNFFGAVQKGNVAEREEKWDDAIREYRAALKIVPDDPNTRSDLAASLRGAGKLDESVRELKTALKHDPKHVMARVELARSLAASKKTKEAVAQLREVEALSVHAAKRQDVAARIARLEAGEPFDKPTLLAMNNGVNDGGASARSPRGVVTDGVGGTISVAPSLSDAAKDHPTLFIYARKSATAGGPPLAVKRITKPRFPFSFSLTQADKMIPQMDFSGEVYVSARLDDDGNATTKNPSDLIGTPVKAKVGGKGVQFMLTETIADGEAPTPKAGTQGEKGTISGTISLAPNLKAQQPPGATLYVYARLRPEGGPPLAVKQVPNPRFPYDFSLSSADAMMPNTPLEGSVYLIVRLDGDGNAMTKEDGDLEAEPTAVDVGASGLKVVIDKVRGGGAAPKSGASSGGSSGGTHITGMIHVDKKLKVPKGAVIFLYAKKGPDQGPPLAVQRYEAKSFPLQFSLGPENGMIEGLNLEGTVYVSARIDADGDAMTKKPGDLVNKPLKVEVGAAGVKIMIDRSL